MGIGLMIIMSQAQASSETTKQNYPFHTAVVEGREVCGILFNPNDGRFYEFQNPETHDSFATFECPRTGDMVSHKTQWDDTLARALFGIVVELINADKWNEFRETYINTDTDDFKQWQDVWDRIREK